MKKLKPPQIISFYLLALILQFLVLSLLAESPPFKIYTTEEGLAHDSVNKIVRDSHGFLWFCTAEGLSRFDGKRFTNFTQREGLPHRSVRAFLELRDGTYLVGTGRGLAVFNPQGKPYPWNITESKLENIGSDPPMFQTFFPKTDNWHNTNVYSLAQEADGTIWAGMELGLYRVTKTDGKLQFEEFEVEKNLKVNFGRLLTDSKGGLIVITSSGFFRIFHGDVQKFSDTGADDAIIAQDGKIWVSAGGTAEGLRVFEFVGDRLTLTHQYLKKDGLEDDVHLRTVLQTSDGRIYTGGDTIGLAEFLPEAAPDKPHFRTWSKDKVVSLGEDSTGNLWIGTESKGAWQMSRNGFVSYGQDDGISQTAEISSIFANRDGEIFLTVQPNKLLHLAANGKFENILSDDETPRSWGWNFLDFEAHDGEWWIPTKAGLKRFQKLKDFRDLAHTAPKRIYKKSDGLWTDEVYAIFEDSRGDVWITVSTGGSETLSRWDRKTDKIYSYSAADGLPDQNGAISFAEDSHGSIWLGHYFGKIARWHNGKFETFGAEDGLTESRIEDLLVDTKDRLWISTSGYGLFRVDETSAEKPVFKSISTQNGLSSNQILCLTQDRFGRVYAGTGRGINQIDQNGIIRTFTQADGLPGNYIPRCAADKKGNLWFISQNTLVRFMPEIEKNTTAPTVFIDKFSVNGVPQKISVLGETEITLPDLNSNQTQIQIDFFALTFGIGENIRYQYRLDNQDWSNSSEQQTLNLNLGAGQHFFEVRAVRTDGITSEKSATVSFRILSPVYARWWFITALILALGLMIFLVYRYRVSNLKAVNEALTEAKRAEEELSNLRAERLAELEKVRSRIATDLHDDIGASLTQIAILSEVAQAQSKGNGASESLTKITNVSNELVGTMSDIVWSINPSKDHLSDLTQRMRRFASDSLSAKGIIFHFNSSEADKNIVINSNIKREVFLIFKESINNIVKHSGAKRVEIELKIENRDLILQIRDNGNGFEIEPLFKDSLSSISMGGNGIISMQKRAEEMNGELEIKSEIGKGTISNLRLSLEQNVV